MPSLTGGDKLRAKLQEIAKKVDGVHSLRVGFLEGATYPDADHTPVAQVAFWLNYGTKTAPPRPFFTNLINEKATSWGDALARICKANDYDIDTALKLMGEGISEQVQQSIIDLDTPALSPITLMLRKMRIDDPYIKITGATVAEAARRVADDESSSPASTKVGVDTGHMLNSVGYKVDNESA